MSVGEMKQDPTVTINWFRVNVPTFAMVIVAATYITVGFNSLEKGLETLRHDTAGLKSTTADMGKLIYRVEQLESGLKSTNIRVDSLQNTIISGMDLMRQDINRLTTQVEVLSSRVGLLTGEIDDPKQRRSRPAVID